LLTDAPSSVEAKQLKELQVASTYKPKKPEAEASA
jgi:aspartyl-tRNA synthetase